MTIYTTGGEFATDQFDRRWALSQGDILPDGEMKIGDEVTVGQGGLAGQILVSASEGLPQVGLLTEGEPINSLLAFRMTTRARISGEVEITDEDVKPRYRANNVIEEIEIY